MVSFLCGFPSVDINITDEVLISHLLSAPLYDDIDHCTIYCTPQNGQTALYIAAERSHLCSVRELLRAGAEVNTTHKVTNKCMQRKMLFAVR